MGMEIKSKLVKVHRWEYFWLCLIVLVTLGMHFYLVTNPPDIIFDELHYINDARIIIANHETMRSEHPPLGKLIIVAGEYVFSGFKSPEENTGTTTQQAITDSTSTVIDVSDASVFSVGKAIIIDSELMIIESIDTSLNQITVKRGASGTTATSHVAQQTIYVFNDNPWGWRVFPILFGTAAIVLFYLLCRRLNMSKNAANIATFLLAFENMTFVQNGLAMLDVFFLAFMMLAFLLYVSRKYILSGISIGLAGLAKLNGLLALPVIGIHWLFTRQGRSKWVFLAVFFAALTFLEVMILCDYAITRNFAGISDPFHRLEEMQRLTGSLTFANVSHPSMSPPWEWIFNYKPMAYWWMPHYTGAISFTIWAMVIPAFIYMLYRAIRGSEAGLFGVAWFTGTYIIWIPATIITDRVTYIFYFYPAIGALCLGLGMALNQLLDYFRNGRITWLRRTLLIVFIAFLVLHLLSFLILSPIVPFDFASWVGISG
jgi:predicted membrane-bound dolichyl-phosphate-mannose-protein mannosyltransferase